MSTAMPIEKIIEQSKYWHYNSQAQSFSASVGDDTIAVGIELFDAKDIRIAPVLRRMIHATQGDCATALRVTLALWADPQPVLTMISMATRHYLTKIHAFKGKNTWGHVCLEVSYHHIKRHKNGADFANGQSARRELHIAPAILEKRYPGGMLRLECLRSLGLSGEALVDQVFLDTTSTDMTLPELLSAG